MKDIAPSQIDSIENLIKQFENAQEEAVARYDGMIQAARNLQQQMDLFEEVFRNSRDAIIVVEGDSGLIRHANAAAGEMVGCAADDLVGRLQATLFPDELHEEMESRFQEVRQEGGISRLRSRLLRDSGEQVDVSISGNILPDTPEGLVVGFIRDISDQVRAEEELRALNESLEKRVEERTNEIRRSNEELEKAIAEAERHAVEAEAADRAKNLFIANMTHEIRTPLNSVVGLLELLMDMDLGDLEKETAEVISRSAETLGRLINDILDYSKIEAGKLELEETPFDLPELMDRIMETFTFQAREKNLELKLELDENLPEFIIGDPLKLRQILTNLMGNALKFTAEGSVSLRIKRAARKGSRCSLKFAVQDTGTGIPEDIQKDMLKPFTQADSTITRKFGGTGLGLNIASRLVDRMGGKLEVESWAGQGSTFFFTVEFGKAGVREIARMKKARRQTSQPDDLADLGQDGLKILLVEDNKLNLRVARGMLSKLGCAAESVEDGFSALDRLRQEKFDLVFMDLQMPEMDGLETTRRIRDGEAGEENRGVPVIAMTAHASREDRQKCLDAGMDDYVAKPISTRLIGEAIKRVITAEETGTAAAGGFAVRPRDEGSRGGDEIDATVLDQFMGEARKELNLIIGALQNYDFDFAIQEAESLEMDARDIQRDVLADLVEDLIKAAGQKQQEYALELADEIKSALEQMESMI